MSSYLSGETGKFTPLAHSESIPTVKLLWQEVKAAYVDFTFS